MSDSECGRDCPLCMEPFELDDMNFFPCHCKYQICRFCWHRIKNGDSALCPACRQPYPEDPVKFKPMTEDDLQTMKMKKKEKELQRRKRITDNRKHLSQIRVLQKNLVFVVGLPLYLDEVEKLKSVEYFGQYGKVVKVVANNSSAYAGTQAPSLSAYVTYSKMEEALQAVQGVNNVQIDGRTLKASLGTTKYCSTYLKNQQCHKTDCMYLHELADPEASFTKEDMQAQKHQDYERKLMRQMLQRNEESADLAKNSELKTSEETRCSSAPTVKSMLMTSSLTSSSANKGDGGDSSVTSSVDHAWSGGGARSSGTPTTMMMLMHGGDDMKDPFDDTSSVHYDDPPPPPQQPPIESETFTSSTTTASPPSGQQQQQQSGGFPVVKSSSFTDLGTSTALSSSLGSAGVNQSSAVGAVGSVVGVVGDSELLSPHPFRCEPQPVDYYDYNSTQQQQRLHKNPGAVGDDFAGRSIHLHMNTHPLGLSRGIPQQSLGGGVLDEQRENNSSSNRLDRLDYLPQSSPFTSSTTTTISNRNNDFSNEILFDSFDTNHSSLYSSGLGRSAAPGSESRCLPDSRQPGGPVGSGPGPIGSAAVGVGAIGTPSTTLIDDNNLLNSVWPSSLSRSSHDFIGSGRSNKQQQQQQQYNGWPISNNCNNKTPPSPSPFFTHHNTQRDVIGGGMGMIGQPQQHTSQHKDEDDLDFDVFAEGNKEFADIKSTVNHMSFDSSRGFGPGLLGFSDLGHQQHSHVGVMPNHNNKHFQSPLHPLHTPHNFTVPNHQHNNPLGGHLTDDYSSNQFTQDTSEDRRNLFKRLLPPSVKVKFTATETTTTQQQIIGGAPTKSRFASFMSNQQQQESPTEHSSLYNNSGFGWQSSLPLQMSNLGLGGAVDSSRNNGVGFNSYKPTADNFTTATSSAVRPPPGLIGSAVAPSSASPYDPAIIASGLPSTHRQQQSTDSNMSLYSMMQQQQQQQESEPHWMKSLHKLTDINDHSGSAATVASSSSSSNTAPLLVNNMNNNNLHMQQQHSWMASSTSQNKSSSATDPFATTGGNPPPGFR